MRRAQVQGYFQVMELSGMLGLAVFTFFLYASPGPFLIPNPEPQTAWMDEWYNTVNNTAYTKWTSETGERLQLASISFLVIGLVAFVSAVCLILFEDKWVAKIVSKFLKPPKVKDNVREEPPAVEVVIDPENTMSNNPREEQDADIMKSLRRRTRTNDLPSKEGNIDIDLQREQKAQYEDSKL